MHKRIQEQTEIDNLKEMEHAGSIQKGLHNKPSSIHHYAASLHSYIVTLLFISFIV